MAHPDDRAAPRWFELRRSGGSWSMYQQGTHSPDAAHRWRPSIAMDAIGKASLLSGDPNTRKICFGDAAAFTVTASFLGDSSEEVTFDLSGLAASVGFRG